MDDNEKFSELWKQARYDAGISQGELSKRMNVSRKTIQNWESGLTSPSIVEAFQMFNCLGLQPLPYFMTVLYPDGLKSDKDLDQRLMSFARSLTVTQKKKLLFFFTGAHGSSFLASLDMVISNLHTPLLMREGIARSIIGNYEIAKALGLDPNPDEIQPDVEMVKRALDQAIASTISGSESYSMTEVDYGNKEKE